jgi:rhamnose utilization protein RhaD (predicted bifunctional aldolase and dehydrogenase)/NAD(P)-dependent dehydrogenase (short-subunit alcohol dehydrogenase family)
MRNLWRDDEAAAAITHYAPQYGEDVALRVYTSRLIGADRSLVLHGGGNTSVKTRMTDLSGASVDVLCVKGSGADLDTMEPRGLPAVRLAPLRAARQRNAMSDEDMTAFLRANLLDPSAPNPSVETLLHAFLPHKFVDHSHATAILAVTDQPDDALAQRLFGGKLAILPYVMPGFLLAKAVADAFDAAPDVEGVLLGKHGLFTFGATARESYDRMIAYVSIAEVAIARAPAWAPAAIAITAPNLEEVTPALRGAFAVDHGGGRRTRFVSCFRTSAQVRLFVDGAELASYGARGVVTPDHIIRTKNEYFIAPYSLAEIPAAVAAFRARYDDYFAANDRRLGGGRRKLDGSPRVALVPGLGLFGFGRTSKDAEIAADIAEATIETVIAAERLGRFVPLPAEDLFEMEYWSLEQAKLGKAAPKPLEGQIAVITGGGGAIGAATARLFAANGAEVAVFDLDGEGAARAAAAASPRAKGYACDVTDAASLDKAFADTLLAFGGVDILVSNAGAAFEGAIATLDETILRKSFELNFFAHQRAAQRAVAIMRRQGTGGALLFNASKQAVNPGENFGAYGLAKAATLFLTRQYALECGRYGIRANAVNADRIRSGLLDDEMIRRRANARGVTETDYMSGNLLGLEVTADDVAQAFLHHALALKTTGDVTTVDGGNVSAMLR